MTTKVTWLSVLVFALLIGDPSAARSEERVSVEGADDLPRHAYSIPGTVTELLASESDFADFVDDWEGDLRSDLTEYQISDGTIRRRIYGSLLHVAMLKGDYREALRLIPLLRESTDKEAERLLSGLFEEALIAAGAQRGLADPAVRTAFRAQYFQRIESQPWEVIEEEIRGSKGRAQYFGENVLRNTVRNEFDPIVEASGEVGRDLAGRIVGYQYAIQVKAQLRDEVIAVCRRAIDELSVPTPDIWQARNVELDPDEEATPVRVAVWDTGVDTELFEDLLHRNEEERPDGSDNDSNGYVDDLHGIAFGADQFPVPGDLPPLDELSGDLETLFPLYQGSADFFVGRDSAEADRVIELLGSMTPEEMNVFYEDMGLLGQYVHGTHVAGIVAAGNPFARLLSVRQTFSHHVIPEVPSFAAEYREAAILHAVVDYLRQQEVRVVNMSWIGLRSMTESALEAHGLGETPEERAELARQLFEISSVAALEAFRRAAEILFIGAAGNQNQNVDGDEIYPSAFVLPNLLIVGAVNQAGRATDFTSFGSTVGVYANGYDVESRVPGGQLLKASGTSQATPQVTNLAAKILAVAPHLAPAEVIALIERGATRSEEDPPLLLIHPERSLELARQLDSP